MEGKTVEEIKAMGFELIEKDCTDYGDPEDVYRAYWGALLLVKDGVVTTDLDK